MNDQTLIALTPILLGLLFVAIGMTVFIRKKPILLNYRWYLILFILIFSKTLARQLFEPVNSSDLLMVVFFLFFIGYMVYIMRGVMLIGADAEDFKNVFLQTLTENNYQYEQSITSIKIKEPELEISVALQSWVGGGQIRMKSKNNKETFNKIMSQLRTKPIKANLIMPIFYIVIGAFMIAMSIFF